MRFLLIVSLGLMFFLISDIADAQDASVPPGFAADISKPVPEVKVPLEQACDKPVTAQSQSAWHAYDKPICQCIAGNMILPSANNKVLSFLFGNNADKNVTLAVQGWKGKHCAMTFSEGTLSKTCLLSASAVNALMDSLLNSHLFEPSGQLAQTLAASCQDTPSPSK